MPAIATKPFRPGTTGWTAADLDDPRVEAKWERGRYEIINGVLTRMPAAYFIGGEALFNLMAEIRQQLKTRRLAGSFSVEVDIIIDEFRVVKGDSCFMTPADKRKQAIAAKKHGKPDPDRARIYVAPTIVIESVSPGHVAHDRVTKFAWYAEFGVQHFWIIDAYKRTLDAFALERGQYKQVAKLRGNDQFQTAPFPKVKVDLSEVWPSRL